MFFSQTEGERKAFFGRVQEGEPHDYHLVDIRDEKVSPSVKFEITLPLPLIKEPIKEQFFYIFECSSQTLLHSSCQF